MKEIPPLLFFLTLAGLTVIALIIIIMLLRFYPLLESRLSEVNGRQTAQVGDHSNGDEKEESEIIHRPALAPPSSAEFLKRAGSLPAGAEVPFNPYEWGTPLQDRAPGGIEASTAGERAGSPILPVPTPATAGATPPQARTTPDGRSIEALKEIASVFGSSPGSGRGDNRLGGTVTRSGFSGGSEVLEAPLDTTAASEEPAAEITLPRIGGQARGFVMLYLMHSRARGTVEKQIETLLKAEINDLFLSLLTDGTFSLDFAYLETVIRRLNSGGRTLTLNLFLSNGATMRKHETTPIEAGFNLIPPWNFRDMIQWDPVTRSRFKEMARQVRPVLELNRSLNPLNRNLVTVMLEDNLQGDSYRAMRELARGELGGLTEYVRNPCPGCFEGNDTEASGDALEGHTIADLSILGSRDGFALDGNGYLFPDEPPQPNQLSFEQARELIQAGIDRRLRYFGLWRAARQGLGSVDTHPDARSYEVPSPAQSLH